VNDVMPLAKTRAANFWWFAEALETAERRQALRRGDKA
jgi:hypothetical protein